MSISFDVRISSTAPLMHKLYRDTSKLNQKNNSDISRQLRWFICFQFVPCMPFCDFCKFCYSLDNFLPTHNFSYMYHITPVLSNLWLNGNWLLWNTWLSPNIYRPSSTVLDKRFLCGYEFKELSKYIWKVHSNEPVKTKCTQ